MLRGLRLVLALAIGAVAAQLAYVVSLARVGGLYPLSDFAVVWAGARFLLAGADPYAVIGHGAAWEYQSSLVYPLPAVLLATPLAGLPVHLADAAFAGVAFAVCAYLLAARGAWRLLALLSYPAAAAVSGVQWSPLLTAAALTPGLAWLLAAKPNVGVALAAYALPDRRWFWWALGGSALFYALSFLVQPDWLEAWRAAAARPAAPQMQSSGATAGIYRSLAMLLPAGPVALLAAFRWRRPEARLLVALALVPHSMHGYELLPLLALAPATWVEAAGLAVLSWGVVVGRHLIPSGAADHAAFMDFLGALSTWCIMLPATLLVLRRPNEGAALAWRWPAWRAHTPTTHRE